MKTAENSIMEIVLVDNKASEETIKFDVRTSNMQFTVKLWKQMRQATNEARGTGKRLRKRGIK